MQPCSFPWPGMPIRDSSCTSKATRSTQASMLRFLPRWACGICRTSYARVARPGANCSTGPGASQRSQAKNVFCRRWSKIASFGFRSKSRLEPRAPSTGFRLVETLISSDGGTTAMMPPNGLPMTWTMSPQMRSVSLGATTWTAIVPTFGAPSAEPQGLPSSRDYVFLRSRCADLIGMIAMSTSPHLLAERRALAFLISLVWIGACGGPSSTSTSDASLPACAWSADFETANASPGQCRAARSYLSCHGSNGGGLLCLSSSATECPGPDQTPGVSYSECANQCHTDEYALACGDVGPGPWPQPPATCRPLPSGPGGGSVSCCPCGS